MRARNAGSGLNFWPTVWTARFNWTFRKASAAQVEQLRKCSSNARASPEGSSPSTYASSFAIQVSQAITQLHPVGILYSVPQSASGARQARNHRAHRNRQGCRNFLIRHLFKFTEQQHLAIGNRQAA